MFSSARIINQEFKETNDVKATEEKSLKMYKEIVQMLAPRFEDFKISYIDTPSAKFRILPSDEKLTFEYNVQIQNAIPSCICRLKKEDNFILIDNPIKLFFPPINSNIFMSPWSYSEAIFDVGHEMAHFIRAHAFHYLCQTRYQLNPAVKYDYRWYLSLGLSEHSLWKTERDTQELDADTTSVCVGGLPALKGGITLTAREIIKMGRSNYFSSLYYIIADKTPENDDRLINLLRILKSNIDNYPTEYRKLIDGMSEWKVSPHPNDKVIKEQLINLLKKAEDSTIKVPQKNYSVLKNSIFTIGLAIGMGLALKAADSFVFKK